MVFLWVFFNVCRPLHRVIVETKSCFTERLKEDLAFSKCDIRSTGQGTELVLINGWLIELH